MVHVGVALLCALPAVVTYTWSLHSTNSVYEFYAPCNMQLRAHIHVYMEHFPQNTYRTKITAEFRSEHFKMTCLFLFRS